VNRPRRTLLSAAGALPILAALPARAAAAADFAPVLPEPLVFPRDFGAHPDTRIEWWYLTGFLDAPDSQDGAASEDRALASPAGIAAGSVGIQVTFFRMATGVAAGNPSAFAARQLVLGHAAIADPRRGALLHEERLARTGFGVADAASGETHVGVDRWRLDRDPASGRYAGRVAGNIFALTFSASPTQPLLLQGDNGYSRKGRNAAGHAAASSYYTEPQLRLRAELTRDGRTEQRQGTGWLDHEWSSTLLPPQAAGWDWGGYNLADGSSLTVFRIRALARDLGGETLHSYAALRAPGKPPEIFAPSDIGFTPLQYWTSPRTRARYPVGQRIQVGRRIFETRPLMPDQEFDARASSGVAYWEGASALLEDGRAVGRGYLELTGYAGATPGAVFGG
jgi:predicted secreted hydrolase